MDILLLLLIGVIAIAVVTTLAQRLGVAGPLLLVGLGVAVGALPFIHVRELNPDIILVGVLPPLLYSAAVNLPALEFRRDLRPIAGLSVMLVVISSIILGLFFWWAIPAVGLPLGIALGAILSPTDAVATSIAKRLGIAPRVVVLLEGESLLNDATALVLLRTAIVAIAGSFSLWSAVGAFVWGVAIAIAVGAIVGWLLLRLRAWVRSSAANTAISLTVPFLAYLPTEHLNGSGLVAAVVAGLVTGQGAIRRFTPEQRLSDTLNWRMIELVLEGAVFLLMGLELKDIVRANVEDHEGLWYPFWIAMVALAIILAVRTAYVALLVWRQGRRAAFFDRARLAALSARIESGDLRTRRRPPRDPDAERRRRDTLRARVGRSIADADYYRSSPLGWKHGVVIVWGGMRGVVTLAASQTLTSDEAAGHGPLLVFIAFLVALVSLMLQGFTLPWVVRLLRFPPPASDDDTDDDRARLDDELAAAANAALSDPDLGMRSGERFPPGLLERMRERTAVRTEDSAEVTRTLGELRLVMIDAMRERLLALASDGTYGTADLRHCLAELDSEQLSLELRLGDERGPK